MYDRTQSTKNLRYGSLEKIIKAYGKGAGIFFRQDVEILINEINKLKNINDGQG